MENDIQRQAVWQNAHLHNVQNDATARSASPPGDVQPPLNGTPPCTPVLVPQHQPTGTPPVIQPVDKTVQGNGVNFDIDIIQNWFKDAQVIMSDMKKLRDQLQASIQQPTLVVPVTTTPGNT